MNEANIFVGRFFYPLPHNGMRSEGLMSIDRRWEDAKIVADIALDILQEKASDWCDEENITPVLIHLQRLQREIKEL